MSATNTKAFPAKSAGLPAKPVGGPARHVAQPTARSESTAAGAHGDLWLLGATLTLLAISVLMVFSTTAFPSEQFYGDTTAMVKRHLAHITAGLICCALVTRVSPQRLYKIAPGFLVLAFALLAIVLVPHLGHRAGGAQRWLAFGPLRVQPGEVAKLAIILYIASYIERNREVMTSFFAGVLVPFFVIASAGALLLAEPDFGSTAVIFLVVLCQLLTSVRFGHLLVPGILGASMLGTLVWIEPYRMKRMLSFLNPLEQASGTGYQLMQSLIAVGSGGMSGAGLGAGKQKLFYLPAAHTDFIYAVIAEELGLAGAIFVLALFLLFLARGLLISARLASQPFLCTLALGSTLLIVLPALLNMGVVLGLLPTKGLVLPLVAYGGTAMIVHLIAVGVLLSLSRLTTSPDRR